MDFLSRQKGVSISTAVHAPPPPHPTLPLQPPGLGFCPEATLQPS